MAALIREGLIPTRSPTQTQQLQSLATYPAEVRNSPDRSSYKVTRNEENHTQNPLTTPLEPSNRLLSPGSPDSSNPNPIEPQMVLSTNNRCNDTSPVYQGIEPTVTGDSIECSTNGLDSRTDIDTPYIRVPKSLGQNSAQSFIQHPHVVESYHREESGIRDDSIDSRVIQSFERRLLNGIPARLIYPQTDYDIMNHAARNFIDRRFPQLGIGSPLTNGPELEDLVYNVQETQDWLIARFGPLPFDYDGYNISQPPPNHHGLALVPSTLVSSSSTSATVQISPSISHAATTAIPSVPPSTVLPPTVPPHTVLPAHINSANTAPMAMLSSTVTSIRLETESFAMDNLPSSYMVTAREFEESTRTPITSHEINLMKSEDILLRESFAGSLSSGNNPTASSTSEEELDRPMYQDVADSPEEWEPLMSMEQMLMCWDDFEADNHDRTKTSTNVRSSRDPGVDQSGVDGTTLPATFPDMVLLTKDPQVSQAPLASDDTSKAISADTNLAQASEPHQPDATDSTASNVGTGSSQNFIKRVKFTISPTQEKRSESTKNTKDESTPSNQTNRGKKLRSTMGMENLRSNNTSQAAPFMTAPTEGSSWSWGQVTRGSALGSARQSGLDRTFNSDHTQLSQESQERHSTTQRIGENRSGTHKRTASRNTKEDGTNKLEELNKRNARNHSFDNSTNSYSQPSNFDTRLMGIGRLSRTGSIDMGSGNSSPIFRSPAHTPAIMSSPGLGDMGVMSSPNTSRVKISKDGSPRSHGYGSNGKGPRDGSETNRLQAFQNPSTSKLSSSSFREMVVVSFKNGNDRDEGRVRLQQAKVNRADGTNIMLVDVATRVTEVKSLEVSGPGGCNIRGFVKEVVPEGICSLPKMV